MQTEARSGGSREGFTAPLISSVLETLAEFFPSGNNPETVPRAGRTGAVGALETFKPENAALAQINNQPKSKSGCPGQRPPVKGAVVKGQGLENSSRGGAGIAQTGDIKSGRKLKIGHKIPTKKEQTSTEVARVNYRGFGRNHGGL